jgi:hypothetical protein
MVDGSLFNTGCPSFCKLSHFCLLLQNHCLGKFNPDLAQFILGKREFKFIQMNGNALLQGEIIAKE